MGEGLAAGVVVGIGEVVGDGAGVVVGIGEVVGDTVGAGEPLGNSAGTGSASRLRPSGAPLTTKSVALSLLSNVLPLMPPGRRSIELPAAGAVEAVPSTNPFTASPHPTASIGAPPVGRSTIAPPEAERPPEYVASAADA